MIQIIASIISGIGVIVSLFIAVHGWRKSDKSQNKMRKKQIISDALVRIDLIVSDLYDSQILMRNFEVWSNTDMKFREDYMQKKDSQAKVEVAIKKCAAMIESLDVNEINSVILQKDKTGKDTNGYNRNNLFSGNLSKFVIPTLEKYYSLENRFIGYKPFYENIDNIIKELGKYRNWVIGEKLELPNNSPQDYEISPFKVNAEGSLSTPVSKDKRKW